MTTAIDSSSRNRSTSPAGPAKQRTMVGRRRGPVARLSALLALVVLLAVGCSSGPGSREDFLEVLTRDGSLSEEDGTCIVDLVFDEYEADSEALAKISAAPDFAYLGSDEGVPGFTEFFEDAVAQCSTVGPTTG